MVSVKFITSGGEVHVVETMPGYSVMQSAVRNGVPGIEGNCGGVMACATCHVYVDEHWRSAVGEAGDTERELIDMVYEPKAESRLSCQIELTESLSGLVVRLPLKQI